LAYTIGTTVEYLHAAIQTTAGSLTLNFGTMSIASALVTTFKDHPGFFRIQLMALCLPSEPRATLASKLRGLEDKEYNSGVASQLADQAVSTGLPPEMLPKLDPFLRARSELQNVLGHHITTSQYLFLASVYGSMRNPDTLNLILDAYNAAKRSETLESAIPIVAAAALRNPAGTTFAPSPPSREAVERILGPTAGFGAPRSRDRKSATDFASIWLQGKWKLIKTQCAVCYGTPYFTKEVDHQQCSTCGSGYCSEYCHKAHVNMDHKDL
jgi:hypothetical protein